MQRKRSGVLKDFYTFVYKKGFISLEHFQEIKEIWRDKVWFDMRLKRYFNSDEDEYFGRIPEYDYCNFF